MTTFEKIRTAALARLDAGENLEHILQDYADYEDDLRPILEAAAGVSLGSLASTPRPSAQKIKPKHGASNNTLLYVVFGGSLVLLLFGLVFFFGVNMIVQPQPQPPTIIYEPLPTEAPIEPTQIGDSQPVIVADCAALDQQQITSAYALNRQNTPPQQVSPGERKPVPSGGGLDTDDGSVMPPVFTAPGAAEPIELGADSPVTGPDVPLEDLERAPVESEESAMGMGSADDVSGAPMPTAPMSESARRAETNLQVVQEPLRAGEIDDNAEWDTYQAYRRDYIERYGTYNVRDLDTTDRQIIAVTNAEGQPVLGACVEIFNGESLVAVSRTYATGLTMFFPNLSDSTRYVEDFTLRVSKAGVITEANLDPAAVGGVTDVMLDVRLQQQSIPLDVVFLLDATGSMSDEIEQLQENILTISAQIDALPGDIDARYGLVTYRDRGDAYVTRTDDFVDDVAVFQRSLRDVVAGGGGDYPESLNEGFDMALNNVAWRGEDAIKLIFLVADAPPHVDYANDADYSQLMQRALARGIKVHSIASSGLQPEGEFVLRQISQVTMGRFIFLTYEDGVAGTPGDDRPDLDVGEAKDEQGVGDYSVSQLDELVLRLITDEIAALRGE